VTGAEAVAAYLAARPEDQRACLEALRVVLVKLLPEADEVMSYAMPGFRQGGRMVAGYAGFARNCGFYPHSGGVVPGFAAELDALGFRYSKSGVNFTPAKPLPDDLVARLVAARLAEAGVAP
jgi:uncharacterized protein YdhG (YjbR/CyaY superfamily)